MNEKIENIMEDMLQKSKEIDQEGLCVGLFNIRNILEKYLTPQPSPVVNGVDELEKQWKEHQSALDGNDDYERGIDAGLAIAINDLKSLKQTPVTEDSQLKEVEIKKPVYCNSGNMSNRQNCICGYKLVLQGDMYCGGCGAKIKWIA